MKGSASALAARRLIIPLFITDRGCPHRCVFCRRNGTGPGLTASVMEEAVSRYIAGTRPARRAYTQIAFYGGNFTGLDPAEQEDILGLAGAFIKQGTVQSLRVSTRPDFLGPEQIERLKAFQVKTVEIGAQSMVDEVLALSGRGHSSATVRKAVQSLKQEGFETGVHLMAGLPGDSRERFFYTVEEIIRLKPDMVRIHPTLVFTQTRLADAFARGDYRPLSMGEAVDLCGYALRRFEGEGIPVIRLGLHPPDDLDQGSLLAGPFHPAFRALVEGALFLGMAGRLLTSASAPFEEARFFVSPRDSSCFRGLNNRNIEILRTRVHPAGLSVLEDPAQERGSLRLAAGKGRYETDRFGDTVRTGHSSSEL